MKVIGVVGYPACGKGEFSRIAAQYNIPVIVMGDIVRNCVKSKGLELTDENVGATARELRKKLGMDAIAILTKREIEKISPEKVLIDGIRGDAEIKYFKSVFNEFHLVCINASFEIRLNRMKSRGRSDDTATPETLLSRDKREESFGLANAVAMADINIDNESTVDEFDEKIRLLFEGLK